VNDLVNPPIPHNVVYGSVGYTLDPNRAHAVQTVSTGKVYQYDNNGNMKSDGLRTVTYTPDNLPNDITIGAAKMSFTYDGNGTRVKKTYGGMSRVYIDKLYDSYDGDSNNYIYAGNTRIALHWTNVPTQQDGTVYYHPDHLGSTSIATDDNGNKVEDIFYYSFGETRQDTGSGNLMHKYTGQELDYETNLYNYGARLYDPEIGRFISPDSIVPNPGDPQSLNRYSYVLNNPMRFTDPTGHCGCDANYGPCPPCDSGSSSSSEVVWYDPSTWFGSGSSGGNSGGSTGTVGNGSGSNSSNFDVMIYSGGNAGSSTSIPTNIYSSIANYVLFGQNTSIPYGPYAASGVDPSTAWTLSLGIYGNVALGGGGGGGTAVNFGNSDTNGFTFSVAGTAQGGAIAGGSAFIGGGVTITNAASVADLNGTSYQFGRAGLGLGPSFALEGVKGTGYYGGTVYGGIGPGYTANSLTVSTTSAIIQFNNGMLSFGNTGASSVWQIKSR
jgi:RHS repeat-associated protein